MKPSLNTIFFIFVLVFSPQGAIIPLDSKILATLPQYDLTLSFEEPFQMSTEPKCRLGTILRIAVGFNNSLNLRIAVDQYQNISECQLVLRSLDNSTLFVYMSYDPQIEVPLTYNIYEAETDG